MTSTAEPFIRAILSVPDVGERYTDLSLISDSGFFSIVFKAVDRETGRSVVIKFLRPDKQDEYRTSCFQREAAIGIELSRHPNIVTALSPIGQHIVPVRLQDETQLPFPFRYFVTEMGVKDFAAYLFGPRRKRPALWRRLQIVRDVAKGVGRLHRNGYCHRDLKPDNVFLFSGGTAKLGDLGTCRRLSEPPLLDEYSGPVGHRRYAAPELFTPGIASDSSLMPLSDWFAVGAITFEAVAGLNLYSAIGLQTVGEIIASFARFGSSTEYLQVVGDISGQYPIPIIEDYLPDYLAARHSEKTIRSVDQLIRRLCHFDFSRRLADASRVVGLIDVTIASARLDDVRRQQRLAKSRFPRLQTREPGTLIVSGS